MFVMNLWRALKIRWPIFCAVLVLVLAYVWLHVSSDNYGRSYGGFGRSEHLLTGDAYTPPQCQTLVPVLCETLGLFCPSPGGEQKIIHPAVRTIENAYHAVLPMCLLFLVQRGSAKKAGRCEETSPVSVKLVAF